MTVFCCSETDCNCEVIERILQLSSKAALWISSESREMFDNYPSDHLNISDEYMSEAAKDDFFSLRQLTIFANTKIGSKWLFFTDIRARRIIPRIFATGLS